MMFHKIRHQQPKIYANAIRRQNSFLADCRMIPITGVSKDLMYYLSTALQDIQGIDQILCHKHTAEQGQWNIQTTLAHFRPIVNELKTELTRLCQHFITKYPDIEVGNLPPIGLAFKTYPYKESTVSDSFDTYISNCASVFTINDPTLDTLPTDTSPSPQIWRTASTDVPLVINTTNTFPASSGVTTEDFECVTQENATLSRRLKKVDTQLRNLLALQKATQPTQFDTMTLDINTIIAAATNAATKAATQAALAAVRQEFAPIAPQPSNNTELKATSRPTDMSFSSQTMNNDDDK